MRFFKKCGVKVDAENGRRIFVKRCLYIGLPAEMTLGSAISFIGDINMQALMAEIGCRVDEYKDLSSFTPVDKEDLPKYVKDIFQSREGKDLIDGNHGVFLAVIEEKEPYAGLPA